VDIATWVVLATPIFVFVFLKAFDCWTADWRLRKRTQWKVPSARRNISALERRLERAAAVARASQHGIYSKRLELLMSSVKENKASYTLLEESQLILHRSGG